MSPAATEESSIIPPLPTGHFSEAAEQALGDAALQKRLKELLGRLRKIRRMRIPPHTPTDEIRQRAKLIRAEVISHLDSYLEQFVINATANGIQVHLARTAADARRIVMDIARRNGVKSVIKSKSMVSEEVQIREELEADGIETTETDIGELLVQLAGQPPSHLIGPAFHMNLEQMAYVLRKTADGQALPADAKVLMDVTRKWLRGRFLKADMGITGANFGIAETGSFFIVTNEGNGRLTGSLPRVHVAMMGIERLLPTLESMPTVLQVLIRSGTGQRMTVYVSLFSGPRKPDELHGPEEQHIVLVDNGRSKLLGTDFAEALECIRCGMCLNACPIYEKVGGHTYQSVYAGPIGKVVTPLYGSSPIANELPHASPLCGACKEVCPVDIDIPTMLVKLRREFKYGGKVAGIEPLAVGVASRVLASPGLYRFGSSVARWTLKALARDGWVKRGPGPLSQWTSERDLPVIAKKPFRQRWKERRRG